MEVIPEIVLRKKLEIYIRRQDDPNIYETAKTMFLQYDSPEGEIATILMAIKEDEYLKAAYVADQFLRNHGPETGIVYYIILYMQHSILYRVYNGQLPEEQVPVMKRSAAAALQGLSFYNADVDFFSRQLESIGLLDRT